MRARSFKPTGPLTKVGIADPTIIDAASFLARRGFRATSIYRPDGTSHETGRSLDVAPMIFQSGGLGLGVARELYDLLRDGLGVAFVVVSESDHVHIELPGRFEAGYGKLVDNDGRPKIVWGG